MVPLVPSEVVVVNCKVSGTGVEQSSCKCVTYGGEHDVPSDINNKFIYSYCLTFSIPIQYYSVYLNHSHFL